MDATLLARKSLLIVATNVVGGLSGLVSLYFLGHYLSTQAVGSLAYALGIAGMFGFLAGLGFDAAHQKRVSEGAPLGDALATFAWIKLALGAFFFLLLLLVAAAWQVVKGMRDTTLAILVVAALYQLLTQLRFIPIATFNARLEAAKSQLLNLVEQAAKVPLVATVALLVAYDAGRRNDPFLRAFGPLLARVATHEQSDFQAALLLGLAYTAAVAASLWTGVWLLRRHRYPYGSFSPALARSYRAYAFPVAIFAALHYIASYIDTVMVGYFSTPEHVGPYYAAQRIVSLVFVVPMAVGSLVFPRVSALASSKDHAAVVEVARRAQRLLSLVVVLATMFLVVYARQGVRIFVGSAFAGAAPLLAFLALYALLFGLASVPSNVVAGFDKPRWVTVAGATMVVVNVVLNLVFIPGSILGVRLLGLGALGAAITTSIAQAVSLVLLAYMTKQLLGHTLLGGPVPKHLLAAALTGGVLYYLQRFPVFDAARIWDLPVAAAAGTLLYLVLLLLLGEVHRSDLALVRDLAHPGRMARYVRDELGHDAR